LQESDLDAARQCAEIYEYILAEFHFDSPPRNRHSATLPSELNDEERSIGTQRRYHVLIQLAHTLHERYQYAGDARDLESAVRHGEDALAICRAESIFCPTVWMLHASILDSSFEATINSEELQMAEMLCRDAISLIPPAHPLSSMICRTLSLVCLRHFRHSGDESTLNEAVSLQRKGLERLPETESHHRHRYLRHLAVVLMQRNVYREHQDNDDILSTISEAFQLCPLMHVDRWVVHSEMAWQLLFEYTRSGDLELLNKSIELGRQALNTGHFPNPSRWAHFLYRMADSLRTRYLIAGTDFEDLEESAGLYRKALQTTLLSGVNQWPYINGLAGALVLQFRSNGNVGHLEEASQLYHHASNIIPTTNPFRPYTISVYAHSLGLRFRETGDISELNRAIDLDGEAVAAMHPSTMNYTNFTLQMVSHLCLRFEMLHENDDLKKAITVAEELLRSVPSGDINRLQAIHILAKVHLLYALDKDNSTNIDLTIERLLSIKDQLSRSSLGPESLRTLSACYMLKFRRSSAVIAALCAKDTIDEALNSVDSSHYERFQCLIDAAKLYMEHGTPYYNIEMALEYLSGALENTHRDVRSKIHGLKNVLTKIEMENHDIFTTRSSTSSKLLDIMGSAVLLLPRIAFFGIHPYSRLQSLKEGQSIAMTGASHALNLSFPEKALEIMEQGRAVFWTHSLRLRSPFDDVPGGLRDRLFILTQRLEKVTNASESSRDQQRVEREIAQRRKESEEFNSLVEQVRCLPGLERFMLPDEYSSLKEVAGRGPVVVLVSSTLGCHAIILKSSCTATSIPLEAVTDKWLVNSASVWRSTVVKARSAMRDGRKLVKSTKNLDSTCTQATQILRLLWINVVFPVIQALGIDVSLVDLDLE
jgi:tetratricopeptide (TPR) repeat protein